MPPRHEARPPTEALADEWQALGEEVDPDAMPPTRIHAAACDGAADRRAAVRAGCRATVWFSELLRGTILRVGGALGEGAHCPTS